MSGYPKYEIRTVIREDIRISEIRWISVISYPYPISELYYPNSNLKSENYADIQKKLYNRIISLFRRSDNIRTVYTPSLDPCTLIKKYIIPFRLRACSVSSQSMWFEWDWMGLNPKQVKVLLNFFQSHLIHV
jgi:hypothetical protein